MKKKILRTLAAFMVMIMFVSLLAGCKNEPESNFEPPEFIFVPEIIQLPEGVTDIRNLIFAGDQLFFTSWIVIDDNWDSGIFSMNMDGTNVMELPNYTSLSSPVPGAMGNSSIMTMNIDADGNLWIAESGSFFIDNTPDDFDGEDWDRWQYYENIGELTAVRKLDKTGAELISLDIHDLSRNEEWFYVSALNTDDRGNIYIGANNNIIVLGNDGREQFRIDTQNWVDSLVRMPDGTVASLGWTEGADGFYTQSLRKIDPTSRGWGETVELPQNVWSVFPGGGDYMILYTDSNNLYGIEAETGESVRLVNWVESNVIVGNIENISILPDGRVICTNNRWDQFTYESNFELIFLTKTPYSELPERKVLTLATVWLNWDLRSHIVNFNQTNQTYRIHVVDYSEFNTNDDYSIGLTRLTTDIVSGRVPDMLDVSNLPFNQYVARGLLEDFYPLIDADPELSRDSFVGSILKAAEMDGGLYRIFPSFTVNTIVGHPSVVGPGPGWNMDEFRAVLDANPQADMPMGSWLTKDNFLYFTVILGIDEYVDWAKGEVYFDRGGFAQLLEFANRFPAEYVWDDNMGYIGEDEYISTGRQIMAQAWVSDFATVMYYRMMFGGDIVFKGFPTESRSGNFLNIGASLAVTTNCIDKDGAWEFIRPILSRDWQRQNIRWDFPLNKAAFDELIAEALVAHENIDGPGVYRDYAYRMPGMDPMEPEPITQADIDMVVELINSASGIASYDEALWNIISEGAADFFSGRSSAQDAARIIQNRASILVSERS